MKAAVIGAGIAGARMANRLASQGARVEVFDKARGPSGRLATRRTESGPFDHGAQYFTVRTASFERQVQEWKGRGVVERWRGRIVRLEKGVAAPEHDSPKRYVGTPKMSVLPRELIGEISSCYATRITSLEEAGRRWRLLAEDGSEHGTWDVVVVAVPAPQAVPLLSVHAAFAERAASARMLPCHALMVGFEADLDVDFDAAFVRSSALGWVAREASKPGRAESANWVLHSNADWSARNTEADEATVRESLLGDFADALQADLPRAKFSTAHRWLFARPVRPVEVAPLWDSKKGLGVCGDWLEGDRVEDAYTSAERLADAMAAG